MYGVSSTSFNINRHVVQLRWNFNIHISRFVQLLPLNTMGKSFFDGDQGLSYDRARFEEAVRQVGVTASAVTFTQ